MFDSRNIDEDLQFLRNKLNEDETMTDGRTDKNMKFLSKICKAVNEVKAKYLETFTNLHL